MPIELSIFYIPIYSHSWIDLGMPNPLFGRFYHIGSDWPTCCTKRAFHWSVVRILERSFDLEGYPAARVVLFTKGFALKRAHGPDTIDSHHRGRPARNSES